MQTGGGGGVPPNPCGVDASASCNPDGGGGANPGAPSGSGYGAAGKTESGGSDGSSPAPAPVTTPRGCGLFGLGCAVSAAEGGLDIFAAGGCPGAGCLASAAEQGWDDFTGSALGGCLLGSILSSDCKATIQDGALHGGHDDRGRNRPARRRTPTRTHPSHRRRRTRR